MGGEKVNIYLEVIGILISTASACFVGWQILSSIKIDRRNRTFYMITALERLMDEPKNSNLILKMSLMDEFAPRVELNKALEIYNESPKNRKFIYKILNYYERLSVSVFTKNIDAKILQQLSGYQILNAHEKLEPFISITRDKYKSQQSPPYQHFDALYRKWIKQKQFKNFGGRQ